MVTPTIAIATTMASERRARSGRASVSSSGVTTTAPIASPSHHARQASSTCSPVMTPPIARLVTPIDALTTGARAAPIPTSTTTSCTRSKLDRSPARRMAHAPSTASSVLPAAIAIATATGAPVQRFATNAPTITPGHMRGPSNNSAANEMPVAGHTSVANPPTASIIKPARAAAM
jgi:hypothetical protein